MGRRESQNMLGQFARRETARAVSSSLRRPTQNISVRTFAATKTEMTSMLSNYHDQLLGTNWGDYLELVHNEPFLTAELEAIEEDIEPYMKDADIKQKYDYCMKATDC